MTWTDIDRSLRRLPDALDDRMRVLRDFINLWYGASAADLPTEFCYGLPDPLRHVYWHGSVVPAVLGQQNRFISTERLSREAGHTTFYAENQWVYVWSFRPGGDRDPPVWGQFYKDEPWVDEGMQLSEFVLIATIVEALFCAPYGACAAYEPEATVESLLRDFPRLGVSPLRWPMHPAVLGGARGAFVFACPNGDATAPREGWSIWAGANSKEPLAALKKLDVSWDYAKF